MHRATLASSLALLLLATAGCNDKTAGGSGGCGGNDACTAGQVCNNDVCQTLCAADKECLGDEICTDQLCVKGSRPQPTLSFVDGDGDGVCPDGSTGRHCLHAGLMVQGTNLLGSSFTLTPVTPAGSALALTVRGGASDLDAQLDLPDVPPGDYLLTATNNSGSADQALTLLQGEPGENFTPTGNDLVNSVNTATNLIAVARLPVGATAITVAAGIHAHAAADTTSGTFDVARLPVGAGASQVAAGNHTHAELQAKIGYAFIAERYANTNVTAPLAAGSLTPTSDAWGFKRNINTKITDPAGLVTLGGAGSGTFTLQPGTYIVHITCPSYSAGAFKCRLVDAGSNVLLTGTVEWNNSGANYVQTNGLVTGLVTIAAAGTYLSVEERVDTGNTTAYGRAPINDALEQYFATVELIKLN